MTVGLLVTLMSEYEEVRAGVRMFGCKFVRK